MQSWRNIDGIVDEIHIVAINEIFEDEIEETWNNSKGLMGGYGSEPCNLGLTKNGNQRAYSTVYDSHGEYHQHVSVVEAEWEWENRCLKP